MPRPHDPYAEFADLYDIEFAAAKEIAAFYREWRESLRTAIARHGLQVRVFVDLACGTGKSTVPWTRQRGWTIVGVDRSAAMLRQARRKSRRIRWIRQDLTRLRLDDQADVATCHFDALNHLLEPSQLQRVFVNVARTLRAGGLFQFDLNTDHWLRWLSRHEKLFRAGPNYFMAYNTYDAPRRTATFHQMWFVKQGRVYERRHVTVKERAYSDRDVRRMLRRAGFQVLSVRSQRQLEGRPIRLLYMARKKSSAAMQSS